MKWLRQFRKKIKSMNKIKLTLMIIIIQRKNPGHILLFKENIFFSKNQMFWHSKFIICFQKKKNWFWNFLFPKFFPFAFTSCLQTKKTILYLDFFFFFDLLLIIDDLLLCHHHQWSKWDNLLFFSPFIIQKTRRRTTKKSQWTMYHGHYRLDPFWLFFFFFSFLLRLFFFLTNFN